MVFGARILLGDLHTGSLGESSLYDMGQVRVRFGFWAHLAQSNM